jgi:hypothetical protein
VPLITTDIHVAAAAYTNLELLSDSTQRNVVTLQASLDAISAQHLQLIDTVRVQSDLTTTLIPANATLTANQAAAVSPDVTLDNFIAALGLSIALAEATMPDRAINSVQASVQSYLTITQGANNTKVAGMRLYQPELGNPSALTTTSFELAKTTTPDAPAPRSLYTVLQAKQAAFDDSFWTKFSSGTPPAQPAAEIVIEVSKVFAAMGGWSFPYVLQEVTTIASLETTMAGLLAAATPGPAVTAYTSSVQKLTTLTQTLAARSTYVAGDLYALVAALDATTTLASAVIP